LRRSCPSATAPCSSWPCTRPTGAPSWTRWSSSGTPRCVSLFVRWYFIRYAARWCTAGAPRHSPFVRSFVRAFVCSLVRLFVRSFVCSFVRAFVCSFVRAFVHSSCILVHAFIRVFIHLFSVGRDGAFTRRRSVVRSFIFHSLSHALIIHCGTRRWLRRTSKRK
jgi:hypothetical protein